MLDADLKNAKRLQKQVEAIAATPAQAKSLYTKAGQRVIAATKVRVRAQQTVSGAPFAPRAQGNKKLLRKSANWLKVYATPKGVTVTWPGRGGYIYRQHQDGFKKRMTRAEATQLLKKKHGSFSGPATKKQAQALKKEGYRRPVAGSYKSGARKGQRRTAAVSQKWIIENMTLGQAGVALRTLRGEPKEIWTAELPARPFFGLTDQDTSDIEKDLKDDLNKRIKSAR